MRSLTVWLTNRGPSVAQALDRRRDVICNTVTSQLKATFSELLAHAEPEGTGQYQHLTFKRTPQRLHRLLLVALSLQAPDVLRRELEWSVRLLMRHGITQHHIQMMVRWYFAAALHEVTLDDHDRDHLEALEHTIVTTIHEIEDEG